MPQINDENQRIYTEQILHRIIRHIPVIITNFKSGVSITLLAQQQQCSIEVIEQIVRLGFSCKFDVPVIKNSDCDED